MRWGTVILTFVAAIIGISLFFVLWPNEERVIRGRLNDIAAIMTVPPNEADLARVTRIANLRNYLSPSLQVQYGGQSAGREAVIGALAQWGRSAGGVKVEFVDVQVTLDETAPDRAGAYLTAKVTTRDSVDAREADVKLARENGVWVVTTAETRETLTR